MAWFAVCVHVAHRQMRNECVWNKWRKLIAILPSAHVLCASGGSTTPVPSQMRSQNVFTHKLVFAFL